MRERDNAWQFSQTTSTDELSLTSKHELPHRTETMPLFPAVAARSQDAASPAEPGWLANKSAPETAPIVSRSSAPETGAMPMDKDERWERAARKRELERDGRSLDHIPSGSRRRKEKKSRHKSPDPADTPRSNTKTADRKMSPAPGMTTFEAASTGQSESKWFSDTKADRQNLEFQSLYSGDVPKYRRNTNLCLTRSGSAWLSYTDGRDRRHRLDQTAQHKSSRYFSAGSIKSHLGSSVKPKRFVSDKPIQKKKRMDSRAPAVPVYQTFISVHSVDSAEVGPETATYDDDIRQRTTDFNQRLAATPGDPDLWLQYVQFQDEAVPTDDSSRHRDAIVLEKQLALFERALKENPRSEVLTSEYLELCRRKLDLSEVEARWKKTVFTHASSYRLWRDCLAFSTSELSQFNYAKAQALFSKALEVWNSFVSGSFSSHKVDKTVAEVAMVNIAVESIIFQRQCGFGERALETFQAMIEMGCFQPTELQAGGHNSKVMALFELFWESGCARFGDSGARGFEEWYETRKLGGETPAAPARANAQSEPSEDLGHVEPWQKWIQLETWREQAHWRPWVPNEATGETDDDCDDPDRVVVLDDVVGRAVILHSGAVREELLLRFFDFMGVPMRRRYSSEHIYVHDCFRWLEEAGTLFAPLAHEMEQHKARYFAATTSVADLGVSIAYGHPTKPDYPFGVDAGQDPRLWGFGRQTAVPFGVAATCQGWLKPSPITDPSRLAFIEDAFQQAVNKSPDSTYLKLCYIDFLAEHKPKAARKQCKGLLKTDRNNLLLLNRYAELEAAGGKISDAFRVYETAIAMGQQYAADLGVHPTQHPPFVRMCRSFAELLLRHDNLDRAAVVLAACAGESWETVDAAEQLPNTLVLKTKSTFEKVTAPWTTSGDVSFTTHASDLVACRALLEYSLHGLHPCVGIYDQVESQMQGRERLSTISDEERMACEQVREGAALLIHWHCSQRRNVSPGVLRGVVERGLDLYPGNATLLTLFVANEAQSRVAGRIRERFSKQIRRKECPIAVFLFAIYAELSQAHGASVHRVRATFEAAATHVVARRCPLLWRMYLEFERAQPTPAAPELARAVFYRAIQNCPGVKSIYLDGPSRVPSLFQEAVDILQEKELHLRTPLEEVELIDLAGTDADLAAAAAVAERREAADDVEERENDEVEAVIAEEARQLNLTAHAFLAAAQ